MIDDAAETERPPATGVDAVDVVLASVADLSDRPVTEHVAAFEAAQVELRRTLDATTPSDPA